MGGWGGDRRGSPGCPALTDPSWGGYMSATPRLCAASGATRARRANPLSSNRYVCGPPPPKFMGSPAGDDPPRPERCPPPALTPPSPPTGHVGGGPPRPRGTCGKTPPWVMQWQCGRVTPRFQPPPPMPPSPHISAPPPPPSSGHVGTTGDTGTPGSPGRARREGEYRLGGAPSKNLHRGIDPPTLIPLTPPPHRPPTGPPRPRWPPRLRRDPWTPRHLHDAAGE